MDESVFQAQLLAAIILICRKNQSIQRLEQHLGQQYTIYKSIEKYNAETHKYRCFKACLTAEQILNFI